MSALAARRLRQEAAGATPEAVVVEAPPAQAPSKTKQTRKKPLRQPSRQDSQTGQKKQKAVEETPVQLDADNMFSLLRNPITFFNNRNDDVLSDIQMEEAEEETSRTPAPPPVEVRLSNFEPSETNVIRHADGSLTFGLLRGEVCDTVAVATLSDSYNSLSCYKASLPSLCFQDKSR